VFTSTARPSELGITDPPPEDAKISVSSTDDDSVGRLAAFADPGASALGGCANVNQQPRKGITASRQSRQPMAMGLDFSCRRNTLPKPRPPLSALTRAAILEPRAGLRNGAKADPKEAIQNITKTLDKERCILLNLRDLLLYREEKLLLYYEGATTTPASLSRVHSTTMFV